MDSFGGVAREVGQRLELAFTRGKILQVLKEYYTDEFTEVTLICSTLGDMSVERLAFHLTYLEQQEYVRIWRWRDLQTHRSDRTPPSADYDPNQMRFAKLLPKGVQLLEGGIPPDPVIKFS